MAGSPVIKGKTALLGVVTKELVQERLTDKQRAKRDAKATVCKFIRSIRWSLQSELRPAILAFIEAYQGDSLPLEIVQALRVLTPKSHCPSLGTLYRWNEQYGKHLNKDEHACAPKHKGSVRREWGWEARAIALYNRPQKPSISLVARILQEEGFDSATDPRVRRYITSLPEQLGAVGVGRLGVRAHVATQRKYVDRSTDNLPPGACYQGDGHTLDVYLQHPTGNKPWRAELTLWLDVASRYVVGWHVSEAESGYSTIAALQHALAEEDHIPSYLHIDNGSGYKNKMMSEENIGIYEQLGISIMHSIPYNAKAKGQVERFFGTMERDLNKQFESYCGHDMSQEVLQKLLKDVARGKKQLPTLKQWIEAFDAWLIRYHHRPHRGLDGRMPQAVWDELERFPVGSAHKYAFWTRETRVVNREMVNLLKRKYSAGELAAYNKREVVVEYNPGDDSYVRVLDKNGRWVCDAPLVEKVDYLPSSRIEEAHQKKLVNQIKRLEVHAQEKRDRAGLTYTHQHMLDDEEKLVQDDSPMLLDEQFDEPELLNNLLNPLDGELLDDEPAAPLVDLFQTDN